jgi:hypothetical protein
MFVPGKPVLRLREFFARRREQPVCKLFQINIDDGKYHIFERLAFRARLRWLGANSVLVQVVFIA